MLKNTHTHTVTEREPPAKRPERRLRNWGHDLSTSHLQLHLGIAASLQGKTVADAIGVRGKENGPKEKGKEKGQGRGRPAARGEAQRRGAPHTRGGKETGPENSAETAGGKKNRTKKQRSTKTTPNQGGRPTAHGGHKKTTHTHTHTRTHTHALTPLTVRFRTLLYGIAITGMRFIQLNALYTFLCVPFPYQVQSV